MAERGRQIGRADEHAVDPIGGHDRVEVVDRGARFGLHQHADLCIGFFGVVGVLPPARTARATHAAHAAAAIVLWITRRTHHRGRLLGGVNHRHQQRLHADVQVLLDQHLPRLTEAHRHARNRMAVGVARNDLQLVQDRLQVVRRMFTIDQQPVEAGASADFGAVATGEAKPQTNLRTLFSHRLLERIHGGLHAGSLGG